MARYLFGSVAKAFQQKRKVRNAKRARALAERQKKFRQGFKHSTSEPKAFDVKPNLPTRGSNRRLTLKRRLKRIGQVS